MVRNIVCNPTTWQAEAGGAPLQGHLGLHCTFQATLGCIMILNLKNRVEVEKCRKKEKKLYFDIKYNHN